LSKLNMLRTHFMFVFTYFRSSNYNESVLYRENVHIFHLGKC